MGHLAPSLQLPDLYAARSLRGLIRRSALRPVGLGPASVTRALSPPPAAAALASDPEADRPRDCLAMSGVT
eukprot:2015899-Alexandrium_andersonii.AAC.1